MIKVFWGNIAESSSPHGFREILFIMSLWEQMTWGMANLDPRGRVYIGDH